jgi:mannosyltransferase
MTTSERRQLQWPDWAYMGSTSVLALALRFYALDRKSFWFDEGASVAIARLDWYNFVRLIWRREANMTLYYLVLRAWQHLGGSEWFIRSLSVAFSVAAIPTIYLLALRLFDRKVAVISSLLLAVNAYQIRYAQEARSYSLYIWLSILSCLILVRYIQTVEVRYRRAFIAISALAVYAHFYFAFLIVAEWCAIRLWRPIRNSESIQRSFYWISALTAPVFLFAATTGVGPLRWIQRPTISDLYRVFSYFAGNRGWTLVLLSVMAISLGILKLRPTLWKRTDDMGVWRYQLLLILTLVPVLLVYGLSYARPLFVPRYFIASQPFFLILVATGLSHIPNRWMQAATVCLLTVLALRATRNYYQADFDLAREDYRSASHYVLDHCMPGDVLMFDIAMGRMPYEFYRSLNPNQRDLPVVIYPGKPDQIDYRDFMGKPSPDFVRSVADRYPRLWMISKINAAKVGPDPASEQILEVLAQNYVAVDEHPFPGVTVRLYSQTVPKSH